MSNSTLCLHSGAQVASREAVLDVPEVANTETWFPTSHGTVLKTVESTIQNAGFEIRKSQFALTKDGSRFFGTLDLTSSIVEGVSLAVGVRNSVDKSFPMGLTAGSRVFVCDNLAFNSNIYVAKRHTKFGNLRFDEGISKSIQTLSAYRQVEAARIEKYRESELTETQASAAILNAYEKGIISTILIKDAIKEWRNSDHAEFAPRTAWTWFNAITECLKVRQSQPQKFSKATMDLYGLVDAMIGFDPKTVAV